MLLPVKNKASFTLVELLVVIAILGILSAAIIVAINPAKRSRQARDAKRKSDISALTNAIIAYSVIVGKIPLGTVCDTSIGSFPSTSRCPAPTGVGLYYTHPYNSWYFYNVSLSEFVKSTFEINLVDQQGLLKNLPLDPKNNYPYYYQYEIRLNGDPATSCLGTTPICDYWIGARLEDVDDPLKTGKMVFRCTDMPLPKGQGCMEIEFPSATGVDSFDKISDPPLQNPI